MSLMSDIHSESFKIFNTSQDMVLYNTLNQNFQTINSSKIINIYKNRQFFINHSNFPSFHELEKKVHNYFKDFYYHDKTFYCRKVINDIINNYDTHIVAEFKDYLIMGDDSEFLHREYTLNECKKYLPVLFEYYKSCSIIFPNYVILHENKYIFKNIRKKQKVIDNQQEQDDKNERIKKGEIQIEENCFFTTKALNSILNQTNTSNLKLFFGINNSTNKKKESDESVNNIFKNIVKAERNALLASKKNYMKKKNLLRIYKNDGSKPKIIINKLGNIINNKLEKGKKINNNKYFKNKNIDDDKSKNNINNTNINKNNNNNGDKKNNIDIDKDNIKILYSNINNITKPKNIIKKNKTRHVKSNTCIFETDSNVVFQKKSVLSNMGSSTKRKMFKIDNSNRKIFKIQKNIKNKNKEIISKIMNKIKNVKSLIFHENNSYNNINKKRTYINMKKSKNPSSISSDNKTNSNIKKKNNCELMININESNSTPNICNLIINKSKVLKEEKEKIPKYHILKIKSNLNNSPLAKFLKKNNSHKMRNNNIILNKNFITKTIKNKIQKTHKNTPNSNKQRYITTNTYKNDNPPSSSNATTISGIKNSSVGQKYNSININKKKRIINSKKKIKSNINNNININININSNTIFNNTSQINNSNNYSLSNNIYNNIINSSILNKKKYYELLKESSSFISKKNESHRRILKRMLLSSASNNNIFNNSKKSNIYEEINKKKNSVLNTNTLTFSRYLTTRNSLNSSKIKNKIKNDNINRIGNMKTNITSYKVKKDLFNKKEKVIYSKNKIPVIKSPKEK